MSTPNAVTAGAVIPSRRPAGHAARRWRIALLAIAVVVFPLLATAAPPALQLRLMDPDVGEVSAASVLSGSLERHFSRPLPASTALEPASGPRWLQLQIAPNEQAGSRVLAVARLPMRRLELFLPTTDGRWQALQRSFFEPDAGQFTPGAYVFELPSALDRGGRAYMRIDHGGRLYLSARIEPVAAFFRGEQRFQFAITAALTTLAVMLLVNLVFAVALRERLYAYYVAFLGVQMLWVLFATGVGFALPGSALLATYPGSLSGSLVTLASALMLHFARHFAELPSRHPRLDVLMRLLMFAFLGLALAFTLPVDFSHRWVGLAASVVFLLLPVVVLGVMLRAWWGGSQPAALFLAAWLPLGAFGAWRTMISFGAVAPDLAALYAPLFAIAYESIVLSLALAWRMLELRIQRDRAQFLADYDALTGGYSRRAGELRLQRLLQLCHARSAALSLVFFDLDHLKEINDVHGHSAGDACLRELGGRVARVLDGRGELIRWGGDEFIAVLPDCGPMAARTIGAELCESVRRTPIRIGDTDIALGISAGVASAQLDDMSVQCLVERADRALYDAKRQGRGRVVIAEPGAGSSQLAA